MVLNSKTIDTHDSLIKQLVNFQAFPKNSTLTSHFSQAILNISESKEMDEIEERYFKYHEDEGISNSSLDDGNGSLTTYSFAGLFILFGILSLLALLVSEHRIWKRHIMLMKMYSKRILSRRSSLVTNLTEEVSITRSSVVVYNDHEEGSISRKNIGSRQHEEYNHTRILVASLP